MTPDQIGALTPEQRERVVEWLRQHRPQAYRTLQRLDDVRFTVAEPERDALRVAVAAVPDTVVAG